MSILLAAGPIGQQSAGGAFDPETDITWHSLFWAEGTDFAAEGYSDTDAVTTWPNETGEQDATGATGGTYNASDSNLNSKPSVGFDEEGEALTTGSFTSAPTYPVSFVVIAYIDGGGGGALFDGLGSSTQRNMVWLASTDKFSMHAGSTLTTGSLTQSGAHGFVALFNGAAAGNEKLRVDDVEELDGNAGSGVVSGIWIADRWSGTNNDLDGDIAFLGIYEGDITADGAWSDMQTWADTHYGVTL